MIIRQSSVLWMQLLHNNLGLYNVRRLHLSSVRTYFPNNKIIRNPKTKVDRPKFIVWKGMKIKELARSMDKSVEDVMEVICRVTKTDQSLTYSSVINDISLLSAVAKLCGGNIQEKKFEVEEGIVDRDVYRRNIYQNAKQLQTRPPVVTIMGHVDHGKTTLIDSLRSSRIVDSEFGGITQHIGAFKVKMSDVSKGNKSTVNDDIVTFLDTPGHAAFSAMRNRGANCTDIIVLVVSVEDGIMPQTIESIRFAKEAKVPIIVAINKIDLVWKTFENYLSSQNKSLFQPIQNSLCNHGVVVEELGGNVQCVPISAVKKWNLDLLQESILVLAEVIDIRADYGGLCEAVVLEANMLEHLGKVSTVLVQQGCLKPGKIFVAGNTFIKIRSIKSDKGDIVTEAKPGDPVQITGWKNELPSAGDVMIEVENESKAKDVLQYRKQIINKHRTEKDYEEYERNISAYKTTYKHFVKEGLEKGIRVWKDRPLLADYIGNERIKNGVEIPQANIIIKTDVYGSLEAITHTLENAVKSCEDQCLVKIAQMGVGKLTENDIEVALATNSVIYLFNLPQSFPNIDGLNVDIRHFNVIYHLLDDLKDHLTSILPSIMECEIFGEAEVLQVFQISEKSSKIPVSGSKCFKGTLYKSQGNYLYRIMRPSKDPSLDNKLVQNNLVCRSLRHLKNNVEIIRKDNECGVVLCDDKREYVTAEVGDIIQCYKNVPLKQTLIWDLGFD